MKCIAFNCTNDDAEGTFDGNLCTPCHRKLTTGQGAFGTGVLFDNPHPPTMFEDVGLFHLKMGLPAASYFLAKSPHISGDTIITPKSVRDINDYKDSEIRYRLRFLFEELQEFVEGFAQENILMQADALADLVWIALGTAHYLGIPFDRVWAEVRRANMEKRPWKPGDSLKPRNVQTEFEVVKPAGWLEPNIAGACFPSEDE